MKQLIIMGSIFLLSAGTYTKNCLIDGTASDSKE